MDILIKNGFVTDPANKIENEVLDILISNGKIKEISKDIDSKNAKILDASGKWVFPGFIDLHVHLREPGFEYKETIKTGSKSAVAGGFSTICCMPNTKPVIDSAKLVSFVKDKAKLANYANVLPIGSITKNQEGNELSDIEEMFKAGICAISEDGKTLENTKLMADAFKETKRLDIPIFSHCEDISLVDSGVINKGAISQKYNLKGISEISENVIIARDIVISEESNAKLHICHVSTKGGVEIIRTAKKFKKNLTAEVCPHHFILTDDMIPTKNNSLDVNYKMNPPLRTKEDVKAILEALKDGTLDVIATDHAPHDISEKNCSFEKALNGIVGLETVFSLGITELVNKNILSLSQFIAKLTINPAKIIGKNIGELTPGFDGDITIVDPNKEFKIDVSKFASKAKNSPFNEKRVSGKIIYTIVKGNIVYDNR